MHGWRSLIGCSPGIVKSRTQLSDFTFTFHFHALEKEMATHSIVLAWRIPKTEESGRLQSMGSQRVRHDWACSLGNGHRTGKGQFSFQPQRKAMPKNVQTTAQLHSSYKVAKRKWSRSFSLTLCNPLDCSLPGSSVHGILQARILEWVAISFSKVMLKIL